jgi:D-3-phosphoglycerate dehydrogenase
MLTPHANVDCSYDLKPEELCAKISLCDAIIVRSGTKVRRRLRRRLEAALRLWHARAAIC